MIAFLTSARIPSAIAFTPSTFMQHLPSPAIQFARHAKRIGRVFGAARFRENLRERIGGAVARPLAIEELVQCRVLGGSVCRDRRTGRGGGADRASDARPYRGSVSRHDAVLAFGH